MGSRREEWGRGVGQGVKKGVEAQATGTGGGHPGRSGSASQGPSRVPKAIDCCDPMMGDTSTGFYCRPGVPEFLRDQVVPAPTCSPQRLSPRPRAGPAQGCWKEPIRVLPAAWPIFWAMSASSGAPCVMPAAACWACCTEAPAG